MTVVDRQSIAYRPIREDDREFLYRLYASTRAEEMKMVPWTEAEKEQFVRMQFHAQTTHYADQYDTNEFFIIEQNGRPIGRLYFDRGPEEVCIVDITLLPENRGAGLGTMLLQEILDEAQLSARRVEIYVENFNPAKRLYERLGFRHVDTNGVYHLMRWESAK
jgi:RimJ/RimL family protein N-acetyltransferase